MLPYYFTLKRGFFVSDYWSLEKFSGSAESHNLSSSVCNTSPAEVSIVYFIVIFLSLSVAEVPFLKSFV
jgi:hypothetical protein